MYLSTGDILAVMIALIVSVSLVITTAVANARLTRAVKRVSQGMDYRRKRLKIRQLKQVTWN
jgi:hypothetical protein